MPVTSGHSKTASFRVTAKRYPVVESPAIFRTRTRSVFVGGVPWPM